MAEALTIRALPGGLGAELTDVDLRPPMADATSAAIRQAFLSHRVLVVREQTLSADDMASFAAIFGEVEGNVFRERDGTAMKAVHQISNLDANGQPVEQPYIKSNYFWHSDKAYLPIPALLTMLHALELPPSGGDTQFADMTAAYAALPEERKRALAPLVRRPRRRRRPRRQSPIRSSGRTPTPAPGACTSACTVPALSG